MNRYEFILKYGQKYGDMFTCRHLFKMQHEASQEYNSKMDLITESVLKKYHRTLKQWREEISAAGSFYFIPSPEMIRINREIKRAIKKEFGFLPPIPLYSIGIFSGNLSALFRKKFKQNKTIERKKIGKLYFYYLKECSPVWNETEQMWE